MKKIAALILCSLLAASVAVASEPNEADQKWLCAVVKMVSEGKTQVSTQSEARVNLLKEWASKNGYSVRVTKTDTSYRIEVSKELAKN